MMTKNPIILVTCVLLLSSLVASESGCCFKLSSTRLPMNRVVSYSYTDNRCSKEAVKFCLCFSFTMQSGLRVCADPSQPWVQKIIMTQDLVQANVTP
ncbi:C-C motif chemokine 4-like [Enoplosus armatus]|uniref:C-C motif chemokine 4-like n=1 Tax=Enoplosus armatus TaxID=215367 RepID=UPI0039935725